MKTTSTRRLNAIITLSAAALALSVGQQAVGQKISAASGVGANGVGAVSVAETKAMVIGIDTATNSVTLRGAAGRVAEIEVNPQVGDVRKLQIGDVLDIQYRNALLIHADKVKSDGIRERVDEMATVPVSNGATASAHRVQVLGTIQKIDAKKRLITLRGPTQTYLFAAAADVPLAGLKVGDSIHAVFESATAVQVTRNGVALQ